MDAVVCLDGVVRDYAWGSATVLPELLGVPPTGGPAAELWFGDHAGGPSTVPAAGTTLDALIAADPHFALGAETVQRFGTQLPFLLKVLAVERPLSIQVHPTLAQARAGFAAEEAAGVARDAADRNYGDANHKPELLYALSPFEALCGFRPVASTLSLLDDLDVPELGFVVDLLRHADGVRAAFTALLSHPDPSEFSTAVAACLGRSDDRLAGARLAANHFPGDVGVVLALLLNHVRLQPGEAIFVGAGTLHAYLRGTGVEIMASSDNVLRCGLTPKHVDADELLKITDFDTVEDPRWRSERGVFSVPVPDFALAAVDAAVDAVDTAAVDTAAHTASVASVASDGPRLVLPIDDAVAVEAGGMRVTVARAHAAFVAAAAGPVRVAGRGRVVVGSIGSAVRRT